MTKKILAVFTALIVLTGITPNSPAVAEESDYVTQDCIDFSAEGFRLMVTNFCKRDIGDLWVCRARAQTNECDQEWTRVGELKIRDYARVKNASQKPDIHLTYRACYAPKKIEETESGRYRCV